MKDYARVSYQQVGGAIVDFCNHFLEQHEHVTLIKPRGPMKEAPTLAMPTEMLQELRAHIEKRFSAFEPVSVICRNPNNQVKLAKYLGKSPDPTPSPWPHLARWPRP